MKKKVEFPEVQDTIGHTFLISCIWYFLQGTQSLSMLIYANSSCKNISKTVQTCGNWQQTAAAAAGEKSFKVSC